MHELSLTQHVVSLVTERAAGRPITEVRLRIGRLAGVHVEAVKFCFDVCAQGTSAEGARLVVEEVEGRGECTECGKTVALEQPVGICPCEKMAPVRILAGEELSIVAITMEAS
jgi:hydrogenase nickel incorporation protein HypA/HybF